MNKPFQSRKDSGFTLVELLIVGGFIALLTFFTMRNFSKSKVFFNETISVIVSDIRLVQTKAISGAKYQGSSRCGYGIHRNSNLQYKLYIGPVPSVAAPNNYCQSTDRNYTETGPAVNRDVTLEDKDLFDKRLEFKNNWSDIFFEPIEPKVFINNLYTINSVQAITLGYLGQACSVTYPCKSICIYGSNRVETVAGLVCPAP